MLARPARTPCSSVVSFRILNFCSLELGCGNPKVCSSFKVQGPTIQSSTIFPTLDAKRKQFDAYQKWAVARCKAAFDKYNSFKTITRDHAWQCFQAGNLETVDQTILSPDVSRMFNDVMSKLTTEAKGVAWGMDGANVFSVQKQCAEATKKKLEDF